MSGIEFRVLFIQHNKPITGLLDHSNHSQTKSFFKIIKSFEPDVVQLYNLHGYYLNDRSLI